MKQQFPKEFLFGGATADFQYEGGSGEGGRGLLTCDYVTDGDKDRPRQISYILPDGTKGMTSWKADLQ